MTRAPLVYEIERVEWHEDLMALLGWRHRVSVWAWDERALRPRYRPAPYVFEGVIAGWQARARSVPAAHELGKLLVQRVVETNARIKSRRGTYVP